jgi:hypothetical protein
MPAIVAVNKNERAFIDAIRDNTSQTCQHAGCGRLVFAELDPDTQAGFDSLSMRGLASKDADGRLARLDPEFASGLDGIANPTKLVPDGKPSWEWKWTFDPPTELVDTPNTD